MAFFLGGARGVGIEMKAYTTKVASQVLILLLASVSALAGTYYVAASGGGTTWANCTNISTPCTLATANTNAAAGDTVYLRGGTYTTAIVPLNSGTSGSMITFSAYTGEAPSFSNLNPDMNLGGKSYIRVTGMTFSDNGNYLWARVDNGANHNEIDHNTFTNAGGGATSGSFYMTGAYSSCSGTPTTCSWVTHNWIHHNTFSVSGAYQGTGCTDNGGDVVVVGSYNASNTTDEDNYNTIENNTFIHGAHSVMTVFGRYTVIRNNVMRNEPWSAGCASYTNSPTYSSSNPNYSAYNGSFGHRDLDLEEQYNRTFTYMLIEGNRIGYASANPNNDGDDGISFGVPQNIARYNAIYATMGPGILLKYGWGSGISNGGTYNRIYNNTIYQAGYGYPWSMTCGLSTCPWHNAAIGLYYQGSTGQGSAVGNVLKNNILYASSRYATSGFDIANHSTSGWQWFAVGNVANNWCSGAQTGGDNSGCSASGDPLFVNPDITNPASLTLPDLTLQSSSTARDGGTYLTTATSAGSNTTSLPVADAMYFQDGTWGSDLARASAGLGGTFQADWICVGTVSNCAQISSVTYGTYSAPAGTITLASPLTWSNGASIWLYKKSDGTVILQGTAPDIGAAEYNPAKPRTIAPGRTLGAGHVIN